MTKITKLPEKQYVIFCPGCGRKRSESREEAIEQSEAGHGDCCNPKCQGHWETNCYHCHHPKYWPSSLYRITARLKGKKVSRTVVSYVRQTDTPGQAELEFANRLKSVLLVEHGMRWHIEVQDVPTDSPSDTGKVVAAYDHYARGATIYHDKIPVTVSEQVAEQISEYPQNFIEADRSLESCAPMVQSEETARKMTQEEALQALRTYVSQQVEIEAIEILDMVIEALVSNPGEHCMPHRRVKVEIGQMPVDYGYNEALESAHKLGLGKLVPPKWLERFQKLVTEIREEFNLHRPPADVGEQQ